MSANNDEPSIEPMPSVRREIAAVEAADDVFFWDLIVPDSECPECGGFGRPRVVKKYPNGKPHPRPYRHFTCKCGRHWKATISSIELAKKRKLDYSRNH
jgi:hypothetical protein